ncbi:MAG: anaerobic ribonucleoside-triphosphate reductase [archaeon]|jgi:anaerobic ribonucleoside-triphosphate reductase
MSEETECKRQKCEIYSRVVGYVRRVDAWNYGKQAEYKDRKLFNVPEK